MKNSFKLISGAMLTYAVSLFADPVLEEVPVVYEAEYATITGAIAKASYVDFIHSTGDSIEWLIEAGSTGDHLLEFSYALAGGDRPLEIAVDGVVVEASLSFPSTGGWGAYGTVSTTVSLAKGFHKVTATTVGFNGANIDSLTSTGIALTPMAPPTEVGDTATYEAEDAEVKGADVRPTYVDFLSSSGESICFYVEAGATGLFQLDFNYANVGSDRPLQIVVDGNRIVAQALSFPATGGWKVWGTSSVLVFLTEGQHVVTASTIGASGPNMDSLDLTAVELSHEDDPKPEPNTPGETVEATSEVYEAEFAQLSGAVAKSNYVDFLHSTGDSITWYVNAGSTMEYELSIRYALGGADRPLEIKIDGEVVAASLSFPGTGGWSSWSTVSVFAELSKGVHKVTATTIGFSGANIDSLTAIGDSIGTISPIAAGDAVRYEAEEADVVGAAIKPAVVDFLTASGESVTFSVEVEADGFYDLEFIYTNGSSGDRPLAIIVDDRGAVDPALSFPPTGGWKVSGATNTFVYLTSGVHYITAATIGRSGGNLDALVVTDVTFEPEPEPTPDP